MEPQIQYVRSADGTTIAFYEVGAGQPLLISPNLWQHLTATWPGARDGTLRLAREGFQVIRYDMRGMGLSDRNAEDFSLQAQEMDIEAIRTRLKLERFALYGIVHGTPPAMAYAARHPERVSHLILGVPFADGEAWYRRTPTFQGLESFRAMGTEQWELYIRTHAMALSTMLGLREPEHMAEIMLQSGSPGPLSRYLSALKTFDLKAVLGDIRAPTVAYNTGHELDAAFSQAVVAGIPNARLVRTTITSPFATPSPEHAALITRFVLGREPAVEQPPSQPFRPDHGTAIILFADIVESTALTERIGNVAFREQSSELEGAIRAAISKHKGAAVQGRTLGDGVLGAFGSAAEAIAAAISCVAAAEDCGLTLHLGIHAGDVIREAGNVHGMAVNVASRISGLSAPNEILVSSTVRDLARASASVTFDDRGEHALKGVADPQRLFAVGPPRP